MKRSRRTKRRESGKSPPPPSPKEDAQEVFELINKLKEGLLSREIERGSVTALDQLQGIDRMLRLGAELPQLCRLILEIVERLTPISSARIGRIRRGGWTEVATFGTTEHMPPFPFPELLSAHWTPPQRDRDPDWTRITLAKDGEVLGVLMYRKPLEGLEPEHLLILELLAARAGEAIYYYRTRIEKIRRSGKKK